LVCIIFVKNKNVEDKNEFLLVFAALGMLSPSSRGALITAACFLYVFMG
jgi:hypothetical protein